jgi:hypothetical protein
MHFRPLMVVSALLIISCGREKIDGEYIFHEDGISINATLTSYQFNEELESYIVYGTIIVKNERSSNLLYGNQYLTLSNGGEVSRTYLDSPASHVIDFSRVTIEAKIEKTYKVYWVYSELIQGELLNASLAYHDLDKLKAELLPNLGDTVESLDENQEYIMAASGSFLAKYILRVDSIEFVLGISPEGHVKYISSSDQKFVTDEGLRIGDSWLKVKNISNSELVKETGWAFYIPLQSGWNAAFVIGESMTEGSLSEESQVGWFFKR